MLFLLLIVATASALSSLFRWPGYIRREEKTKLEMMIAD
jgi:hypothetical protein